MNFFTFIDNAALLLALSLLSSSIQFRWLKQEPARGIALGFLYGIFALMAMTNPMELQPGIFFDGRSVILSLAGLFAGNITTAIACVIAAAGRLYFGGQGVFTGIGSIIISGLSGIIFRRIVAKKAIQLNLGWLFIFGFCVHLALVLWFFTLPIEIALSIIKNVALPYLVVFPLATMLIGGFMVEQEQRLATEKNLSESEKRFRDLVNTLNEGVWEVDIELITTFVNPRMAEMLGYQPEEMIGMPFIGYIPENRHDFVQDLTEHRKKGIHEQYELEFLRKDGSVMTALVGATPILGEHGEYCGSLAGVQDITELKRAQNKLADQSRLLEKKVDERTRDLKDAQKQLLKAEKMAALGELAGSVGHELRNPLAVIMNSTYLLINKINKADQQTRDYIAMIEKETLNASRIINDLLDYSRIRPTQKEQVNLARLVAGLLEKQPIPENVSVENKMAENIPDVNVNPQQFEQIFDNLISNAIEAMPEGGTLTLKSSVKKNKVIIDVSDTGVGITRKNLNRIFEPLFTTKSRGIGLGLAITAKLAGLNDIAIRVKSQVGKGTTFTLEFFPISNPDL